MYRRYLPNISNSMLVGHLRYIQSIRERPELRNPDNLVRHFIPMLDRWRLRWIDGEGLAKLRESGFYYYLIARTRYYDQLFLEATSGDFPRIINIGSGSDTRAYRFAEALTRKGIKVWECDQSQSIFAKQRIAKRQFKALDYVDYFPIDLNKDQWPDLESRLSQTKIKTFVLMEGVSPYIEEHAFERFLSFFSKNLPAGSKLSYDFKIAGASDDFGRAEIAHKPFRCSKTEEEVEAFHAKLRYRLTHMELGSALSARLLPSLTGSGVRLFDEDCLIQLMLD